MAAESDRCVCPSCAAVCTGRFRGCAQVWAAGAETPLTRWAPSKSGAQLVVGNPDPISTNGKKAVPVRVNGRRLPADLDLLARLIEQQSEAIALLRDEVAELRSRLASEPPSRKDIAL